jgi:hypothetical protein
MCGIALQVGGAYVPRICRGLGGYPRTAPWDPYVFSNLERSGSNVWLTSAWTPRRLAMRCARKPLANASLRLYKREVTDGRE